MPQDVRRAIRLDVVLPHAPAIVALYDRSKSEPEAPDPDQLGERRRRRKPRELDDLEEEQSRRVAPVRDVVFVSAASS